MKPLFQKPWMNVLLGVILALLLLGGALVLTLRSDLISSSYTYLGDRAFGLLQSDEDAIQKNVLATGTSESMVSGYPVIEDEFFFPGYVERFEYNFNGTLPDLSSIDGTVYRLVNDSPIPSSLSQGFTNLTIGGVSLSSLKNVELYNFSIREQDERGFNVYVDSSSDGLSISRNDGYWNDLNFDELLTPSDMLSDETLISTAQQFLNEFSIDTTAYGPAQVDHTFVNLEEWVPDSMSVIFPQLIAGQLAWTLWGQPTGMSISVNQRSNEVESAWIPTQSSFEASTYTLTDDTELLMSFVFKGGLWEWQPEEADKIYTFTLGDPDVVLAEYYQYRDDGSDTLYVPAFRFPVTEADPEASFQKEYVIVPLVDEILKEASEGFDDPILLEETMEAQVEETYEK